MRFAGVESLLPSLLLQGRHERAAVAALEEREEERNGGLVDGVLEGLHFGMPQTRHPGCLHLSRGRSGSLVPADFGKLIGLAVVIDLLVSAFESSGEDSRDRIGRRPWWRLGW